MSLDEHEKVVGEVERVMVDSGAAFSACPSRHAPEIPMSNHSRRAVLGTAPGAQIQRAGQKTIEHENGDGGSVNINFKVADVITPLVAVGELQRRGITVVMGPHRSFGTRSPVTRSPGRNQNFEHCNGAHWMSLTRWGKRHEDCRSCRLGRSCANIRTCRTGIWAPAASQVEERTTLTASQTATADRQGWSVTLCSCRVACNSRVLGGSSSARLKWRVSQWRQRSPRRLRAISW